jgi:hypothetical protein
MWNTMVCLNHSATFYQDVQLQGLNNTARLSVQYEKVNLNQHVVKTENNFWISFASLTRNALEGLWCLWSSTDSEFPETNFLHQACRAYYKYIKLSVSGIMNSTFWGRERNRVSYYYIKHWLIMKGLEF